MRSLANQAHTVTVRAEREPNEVRENDSVLSFFIQEDSRHVSQVKTSLNQVSNHVKSKSCVKDWLYECSSNLQSGETRPSRV